MAAVTAITPGCHSSPSQVPPGYAVVALQSAPLQLDPRFATDANSGHIGELLFASLLQRDESGRHQPYLARDWRQPAPATYVFHLRPDFVFHDGTPLTALDVKATFDSILDARTGSPKRQGLGPVIQVVAIGLYTVRFVLAQPFAPFLDSALLGIMSARQLAKYGSQPVPHPLGAGPFQLRQSPREDLFLLERNARFPRGAPRLPGVAFRVVPDPVVRLLELRQGTIDLVQNNIEWLALPWVRRQPNLKVLTRPGTTVQYLGMNLRHPLLRDVRVRRALALAIDRRAIVRVLLNGLGTLATGLLSPAHWAYSADVVTYPFDPEGAKKLLDEVGHPDPDGNGPEPRFRLSYKTTTAPARRRIAEAIQEQLRRVGVAVDVRSYEWGTFYADIRHGNFQLYSLAWIGISDPDIYYLTCHSSQVPPAGNNRGFFRDPLVDALTDRARHMTELADRARAYALVQRRVSELLPVVPLWWQTQVAVVNRRLRGFVVNPSGSLTSLVKAWIDGGDPMR